MSWLQVHRGTAPLILAFPHTGTDLADVEGYVSPWLARKDADWWIDRLYDFAADLGATTIRTTISRSVIDVNRDPSGASLYPGQATTELCPTTSFDGEPLYRSAIPAPEEIARRRAHFFDPYHAAIDAEIARLRAVHPRVVLYDAHSIRSHVPRLFEGELPQFNIGTNGGATCAPDLREAVEAVCAATPWSQVTDGRFRGGWTTRHYGQPEQGVHAIQMELACRGYVDEPESFDEAHWPTPYDETRAAPMRAALTQVLQACLVFAGASE
jgi:formiminoglutamase